MRKYILTTLLISSGILLFVYSYIQTNKTSYSETIFNKDAKDFDVSFTQFINNVEENINSIQTNFNAIHKLKDTVYSKKYFLNFMEKKNHLSSVLLIMDTVKIGILNDQNSLAIAMDSTKVLDVVRWQRFENNKLISTWQESFDYSINKTPWFKELVSNNNQIKWTYKANQENESFYAGYSYLAGNTKSSILIGFSRKNLINSLNLNHKYNHANLWVTPSGNEIINLTPAHTENDSLKISVLNHLKKFKKTKKGVFKFKYKNDTYWSSYKKFDSNVGLQNYILTIPNKDIQLIQKPLNSNKLKWLSILLVLIGIVIIFVKKHFFYKALSIEIAPIKEILEKDENRYLEFKSSARWDYRQEKTNAELEKVILKTLAAFGNTDGGILLIGVDDDKNILGLENDFKTLKKKTEDYYEIHLRNLFHKAMGVKYVSKYIRIQFENCENKKIVCKIKVLAASEPIYLKFKNKNGLEDEKFYVRSGNSSQEIKSYAEINDYINAHFNN